MSQHLFRCVYAYKVNISRARQQRNRWPKQIFFGEVTLLPHLFLPFTCRVTLRAETFLRAAVRQKRVFCLHARDYFDAGDTFFLLPSGRCRGPIACGRGVRREDMTTTGLIYKRYIGPKSSFFEKMIKKVRKCLHVPKLCLPLHPQSRKQFF